MTVYEQAFAKINLLLDVAGKRPDGYHELKTVFQSLALADRLTFSAVRGGEISLATNIAGLPVDGGNLAWRAARCLQEYYGVSDGVHIMLEKNIPVAAGLGGGSSDAAAVLRGLCRFWGIRATAAELHNLGAQLGSDVPFCLAGGTALGTGRGEKLAQLPPCPRFYVVLANPGFPVSTALVYNSLAPGRNVMPPDTDGMLQAIAAASHQGVTARLANVLEQSTFALYPEVSRLKARMLKWGPALMCGSGATVFALFTEESDARKLYRALHEDGTAAWLTETLNYTQEVQVDD